MAHARLALVFLTLLLGCQTEGRPRVLSAWWPEGDAARLSERRPNQDPGQLGSQDEFPVIVPPWYHNYCLDVIKPEWYPSYERDVIRVPGGSSPPGCLSQTADAAKE